MNLDKLPEIIERYGADKTASLAILQDIQAEYHYLPRAALEEVARTLDVPLTHINASYVRSHFDAFEFRVPDAPRSLTRLALRSASGAGSSHAP